LQLRDSSSTEARRKMPKSKLRKLHRRMKSRRLKINKRKLPRMPNQTKTPKRPKKPSLTRNQSYLNTSLMKSLRKCMRS